DPRGIDLVIAVQHFTVDIADTSFAEQADHLAAAAVAEVGDQPEQLHRAARPASIRLVASMILKPCCCATMRTGWNCASSAASYGRCRFATSQRRPPGL